MKPILSKSLARLIYSAAFLISNGCLFADPTFVTSTFDGGSEGWQPWTTSTVNGISPGNPYLNIAADGSGVRGKMITFNPDPEWTGNYISAGVTGLRLDIANMSLFDDVYLRVALGNRASPQQTEGTWWLSSSAALVSSQSAWTSLFIPLTEADMQVVGNLSGQSGTDTFQETLRDIRNIRILSAVIPLGAIGDEFVGDVGIDNVALVPEPTTLPMIGIGVIMVLLQRKRKAEGLPELKDLRRHEKMLIDDLSQDR